MPLMFRLLIVVAGFLCANAAVLLSLSFVRKPLWSFNHSLHDIIV
ncbi:hypothetical protein QUB77_22420 [Microcoleus sp. AT9b-C3]